MPTKPFSHGVVLGEIPQTEEDRGFARRDLALGCLSGVSEELTPAYVAQQVRKGRMVSSTFTVWKGDGLERKGRFVVNFHRQSQHWPKGATKMETIPSFAVDLKQGDMLMSWDIKSGYRHFYLHPDMRDLLIFRYNGRFYRCVALPFGWGRSVLWFTKILRPFVRYVREKLGYRVLPYIDDFVVAPTSGQRAAGPEDCACARRHLGRLMDRLGLGRHPDKGCWAGSRRLDHLGVHIDTVAMNVFVSEKKIARVRSLAKRILVLAQRNRRRVSLELLRHFCGVYVSLSLALPLARFYTRSIYFDMSLAEREERGRSRQGGEEIAIVSGRGRCQPEDYARKDATWSGPVWGGTLQPVCEGSTTENHATRTKLKTERSVRVRLCRQSLRDLRYWRALTRGEGRELVPSVSEVAMHSDAADVGYSGTLGCNMEAGSPGLWEGRGFWTAEERAQSITLRELRAVRLLLHRHFARYVSDPHIRRILLHEDNLAVVYILNAMVSASKPMMVELCRLEVQLRLLGVKLEARWIPSAVNKFADALSCTWDPGDAQASATLLESISEQYQLDSVAFHYRPMGETMPARRKYLQTQMSEDWGDGRSRLWNSPFDMLPLIVRKIEKEGARGVVLAPDWPAQAWYARLRALSTRVTRLHPEDGRGPLMCGRQVNDRWAMIVAELA